MGAVADVPDTQVDVEFKRTVEDGQVTITNVRNGTFIVLSTFEWEELLRHGKFLRAQAR